MEDRRIRARRRAKTSQRPLVGAVIKGDRGELWELSFTADPKYGKEFTGGYWRRKPKGKDAGLLYFMIGDRVAIDNVHPYEAVVMLACISNASR